MQPFRPKPRAASRRRKLDTVNFEWPIFEAAATWLSGQDLLLPETLSGLSAAAKAEAIAATELFGGTLEDLVSRELQESFAKGEGALAWRKRIQSITDMADHQAEAISRTYTHRAQQAGLDEVMSDPIVGDLFPYLLYFATQDTRVRPEHAAMDGKVAHRDSPLAAEMRRLHAEWNCRCTLAPLTREDAVARGIDDDAGWVEPKE
jgi:SPP1 gp7 family putative phage head morphogenesis protein